MHSLYFIPYPIFNILSIISGKYNITYHILVTAVHPTGNNHLSHNHDEGLPEKEVSSDSCQL